MINLKYFFVFFILSNLVILNPLYSVSISIFLTICISFLSISNSNLAFREFILLLYSLNYLLSPTISFLLGERIVAYNLKLSPEAYFNLAIPGFLLFYLGLFSIKTNLFIPNFSTVNISTLLNERLLKTTTILSNLSIFLNPFLPSSFAFLLYLFSLIQYLTSFSLYVLNPNKNIIWPIIVLFLLLYKSFLEAMYHDAIMWILFFGILYFYINKPSLKFKLIGILLLLLLLLFIQSIKSTYRELIWTGHEESSISLASNVANSKASTGILFGEDNLLSSLTRSNQAWIFASTVDNMDRNKNFQGLSNVYKYFEASILPRFLAPDKIKSGDKVIFNAFSGHTISEGTSMGLGIFADGYIAYGAIGVYIFGFALGLIFALTFKLVERWTKISPFYVLFIFPLLNYAVRPDCELQTTINHLSKGIMLYGLIIWFTKKRFSFAIENPAF